MANDEKILSEFNNSKIIHENLEELYVDIHGDASDATIGDAVKGDDLGDRDEDLMIYYDHVTNQRRYSLYGHFYRYRE
ncbi:8895_t:CDS:2 [Cetraspora pellucida]|uniref:8895_t:CDS:1 n=1 Tax=Cetraspora pellucida TaxID=1433469 RepID=A0A9N9ER24_9GLOM|nr:8895_t:CDS:2 [Cetraspora pellucida]